MATVAGPRPARSAGEPVRWLDRAGAAALRRRVDPGRLARPVKPFGSPHEPGNGLTGRASRSLADSHTRLGTLLSKTGKPSEAEAEYRKALVLSQKLADDNPKVPGYRAGVATAHNNLDDVARSLGRAAEARDGYDRAISREERLVQENPTTSEYRSALAWSLRHRGLARRDLGEPAGARADARRALGLLEVLPSRAGEQGFETAYCHAALCGLAGHDGAGVSAAEGEDEAAKAIGALTRAASMGYYDANALRTESAPDPLHSRDDFRLLMMDVAFPPAPFAATR